MLAKYLPGQNVFPLLRKVAWKGASGKPHLTKGKFFFPLGTSVHHEAVGLQDSAARWVLQHRTQIDGSSEVSGGAWTRERRGSSMGTVTP